MTERLHDTVTEAAASRPDAVAIVDGERSIRYGELDRLSSRLARALGAAGAQPGDRVAILLDKSIEAIATMVAASKAGLLYVPLDATGPAARAAKILDRCRPRVLVSGERLAEKTAALMEREGLALGWLGEESIGRGLGAAFSSATLPRQDDAPVDAGARAEDPAHILFTSGSTGVPKGVVVPHRSVLAFVRWANETFGARPDDRNSGHSPLHFDLSSFDIWGSFAAGAELHLVPASMNLLPAKLAAFIRERRLTQWFSVPSILTYMARFDAVRQDDFPELRRLLWCGEVFPTPALRVFMARLPHVPFTNLYGPTETTIASSYHTLPAPPAHDREDVPIGRPCGGESLHILDAERRPLPPGEIGDLYIGGAGLTLGYWEDAEATARAFQEIDLGGGPELLYRTGDLARVDDAGLVRFLGREDAQIKSRGYRIELGEIESALFSLDSLDDAAVVAIPSEGFEGSVICCAFVAPDESVTPVSLRTALARELPSYMLPQRFRRFDELPKTANGKTDRKTLRGLFAAEDER